MSAKTVTAEINAALRKRYCAPAWALLFNVSDATGFNGSRFADAIAMSVWPSRGLELHGIEVKATRADWQRELVNPQKAEEIAAYCDHWWLVSNKLAAKEEEIPPAWGWIEFDDGKLTIRKQSVKLDPKPMTRAFLAALLRRASEADAGLVDAEVERRDKDSREAHQKQVENQKQHAHTELASLRKAVAEFEDASGVHINAYQGGQRIGEAVRFVLTNDHESMVRSAERIVEMHESAAKKLRDAVAQLKPKAAERAA